MVTLSLSLSFTGKEADGSTAVVIRRVLQPSGKTPFIYYSFFTTLWGRQRTLKQARMRWQSRRVKNNHRGMRTRLY